ncbi:MAG: DUF484 family protein [Maricaulis sp.]|uniref:DUF484 family protein n=1 Tax=Maricaulis sp. TaxID=1486257 RepID=UPI002636E209|nr:DUF484 family protein [Maricaulis sp.]MDM7983637.1 DUF484 family protein [Maricaulis sp.]
MSTTTDETRSGQLDIETIREFLMRNPDFVREDAELFARVTESPSTEGVIDIGNAAREKLVGELRQYKALNEGIVETARANLAIQSQIHAAVLGLLEVDSLAGLDRKISSRLTGALGVDVCRVLIEGHAPLKSAESILGASEGMVSGVMGERVELLGPVDAERAHEIYGQQGARMRSQAIVRLDFHGHDGLFALAARDPHLFQFGQGTELLNFLARVTERLIVQWMHQR